MADSKYAGLCSDPSKDRIVVTRQASPEIISRAMTANTPAMAGIDRDDGELKAAAQEAKPCTEAEKKNAAVYITGAKQKGFTPNSGR